MAGRQAATSQHGIRAFNHSMTGRQTETRRRHLLKRSIIGLIAVLAVAVGEVGFGGVLPAAAINDCQNVGNGNGANKTAWTCEYDQYGPNSANWPNGTETSPLCSPCYIWNTPNGRPGDVPATVNVSNGSSTKFHDDVENAIYGWGGAPYNSPFMYDCAHVQGCSRGQVTFGSSSQGSQTCGQADITSVDSYNRVLSAWANFNSDKTYWDGAPAKAGGCDARSAAYHELGHDFTLGHSSDNADVMYWGGNDANSVTHGASMGLNAMYGPCNCGNGGNGGCNSCQTLCNLSQPGSDCGTLQGWLDKAWSVSQGVGAPNPVSIITPSVCPTSPYVTWITCVLTQDVFSQIQG